LLLLGKSALSLIAPFKGLQGPLATADRRSARADFNHRALDNIVDLLSNLLNLVLAVEVSLNNLIGLNETIELTLKLVVLL